MGYHDERLKLKKFIVIIIIIIIINEEENRVTPSHRDVAGALYII